MDAAYRIRVAAPSDVPYVVALERRVFTDPWSEDSFGTAPGVLFLIAECREERVGYVILRHVADEAEVLNLAVHSDHRRRGVGRALLEHALDWAEGRGVGCCYLEVRASAMGAQAFYRTLGFQPVGRRSAYYDHPVEDAVIYGRCADATPQLA